MSYSVFPWRQGNSFALLIDGGVFFPRMLELIEAAQEQVALELYLLESSACAAVLIQALCGAAQRGVSVRCLFDAYGGQGLQ
ncbi:MAG TPA: phosphatidylserine/phosphatidylglycerophosphate/cardiolipin synthase family protein, partial [Pseudomonas sp.]|nr:phosphatidylserine/phosphatidylglycerophosphate/cardiolipin synthase family protein [Pseudomonas sp.]